MTKKQEANRPHGWLLWRETDARIDLYCRCGHKAHVDTDCLDRWQCPNCKTLWVLDHIFTLIEVEKDSNDKTVSAHT